MNGSYTPADCVAVLRRETARFTDAGFARPVAIRLAAERFAVAPDKAAAVLARCESCGWTPVDTDGPDYCPSCGAGSL